MFTRLSLIACFIILSAAAAGADDFTKRGFPSFQDIEPRMVYGQAVYDVSFAGDGPNTRSASAQRFLEDIVKSRFGGSNGNYIVTLDVSLDGKTIVTEPILSATWENKKFLFITTSEKSALVVNRDGVLLDHLVIDNITNRLGLSFKVYFSKTSSVDLSLFKQISELSKTAAVAAFIPGLSGIAEAFQPFSDVLGQLLSNYREQTLVENTVGAFTLLDDNFPNEMSFSDKRLTLNVYLRTENSQLPRNFDTMTQMFKPTGTDVVLATVASGTGAARATVLDIMRKDDDARNKPLRDFVLAVESGQTLPGGAEQTRVRPLCEALKRRLNELVTTRDSSLVYWAFLQSHATEVLRYADGKACGDPALTDNLTRWGLALGPQWAQ